jgi:hypothetical protein
MLLDNLSPSERRGIAAVFATACQALLAWAFPNMTRFATIPGAVLAAGLAAWFLWPEISTVAQIIFRRRLLNVVAALIVAFAGVSFAYWYYSNIKTNGWYWHFEFVFPTEPGRPTKGGDQKPAEPPKSLEPWVTQDEINLQKTLGRNLLIFSPEELLRRWLNNRDINIYLNNWIKINYAASNTPLPQTIDKKEYYYIQLRVQSNRLVGVALVPAYFDPKKSLALLLGIREGDVIKAYCQLNSIQEGDPVPPYNLRPDILVAFDCEFI